MRTLRAEVSYDGSCFFGWQRQNGFRSVQAALESALLALSGEHACVFGAGRTDTGVHALRQIAHFQLATRLNDAQLLLALNAHLESAVVIRRLETCRDDFHARFDARAKRYVYLVQTSPVRPAFGRAYAHWVRYPLDLKKMRRAAQSLVGRHDFRAFGNTGSPRKTTVRTIMHSKLVVRRSWLAYWVQGEGFLYNQVRNMVGTLIDVGRGRLTADAVERALASGSRTDAGVTAPPEGLYLARVLYDESLFAGVGASERREAGCFSQSGFSR